jgi:hypothetical protein
LISDELTLVSLVCLDAINFLSNYRVPLEWKSKLGFKSLTNRRQIWNLAHAAFCDYQ